MTEQLSLVSSTLNLSGGGLVSFTQRGLAITPAVSNDELIAIGNRLFATKSYLNWALGSVFAEMLARRRPATEKNSTGVHFDEEWLSGYTLAHHLDPKEKREVLGVFQFYARGGPTPPLSYEHHREAMWGVDDGQPGQLDRAIAYLNRAHQQGLSVTGLRRLIRSENATETPEPRQMTLAGYSAVFDFMRYAKRELNNVPNYTREQARLILRDLGESTLSFIDALREIANSEDSNRA